MHQHNILEALFGPESGAFTAFQRIGDRDQAIFGGKEIVDTAGWRYRPNTLTFSNSLRLSPANAKILAPFAYERDADFEIRGLGNSIIPPHIIVYDNKSVGRVIEQFAQLIRALKADNQIPSKPTNRYMAVAWNTVWDVTPNPNQGKLRLIDFFPNFRKSIPQKQKDYERLADYLHSVDPTDKTLHSARRLILGAACTALRLSDVVDPRSKRPFTTTTIMSYIRFELSERAHDRITQALLKCSLNLVTHRLESTLLFLRRLLPKLIRHFGSYTKRATDFLKEGTTFQNLGEQNYTSRSNVLVVDGIEVGLGTVHSVKGQTHTATLYIESAYNSDGGKMYESERLAAQFRGERLPEKARKRVRESAKMVYVGFSRPTHLLVFAVHKIRFDQYLKDINKDTWKIIHAYDERGSE